MCEILNVHVQKVDNGMGSIPVSRLKKERYRIGIVLFFRALPGLESSMSTLRSGPRRPRSPGPRAPSRAFSDPHFRFHDA